MRKSGYVSGFVYSASVRLLWLPGVVETEVASGFSDLNFNGIR